MQNIRAITTQKGVFLENYTYANLFVLSNYVAGRMLTQYRMACFDYELFLYIVKRIKNSILQNKLLMATLANIMVPLQMEKCTSEHIVVQ